MKRILLLICAAFIAVSGWASNPSGLPKLNSADILIPIGKTGEMISLFDLSKISIKDLEGKMGHRLKFGDKIGFSFSQKRLRNLINDDGTINSRRLDRLASKHEGETSFHIGGFALGFFLQAIGVIIAYIINDDNKKSRVKWAWLGWLAVLTLALAIVASNPSLFW